jgi:hypothetical protein
VKQTLAPQGPWALTATGRVAELLDLAPEACDARTLAAHLAKINRFAGATTVPYSVAQHSVLVATMLWDRGPEAALYGLLHDAHEAFLGDIPRPARRAIAALWGGTFDSPIDMLSRIIDHAIHRAHGLPFRLPPATARAVYLADMRALATERRDLMPDTGPDWHLPEEAPPWRARIKPLGWQAAEERWLTMHRELTALRSPLTLIEGDRS